MKVARNLGRDSIGIEIREELLPIIKEKLGFGSKREFSFSNVEDTFNIVCRKEGKYGYIRQD